MIKTTTKYVGKLTFHPSWMKEEDRRGWGTMVETSEDPSEWRGEDVEHIVDTLSVGIKKHPIISVEYVAERCSTLLRFEVAFETKVPKTTIPKNKDMLRSMIYMECL